jgi:hypothetical protein
VKWTAKLNSHCVFIDDDNSSFPDPACNPRLNLNIFGPEAMFDIIATLSGL